MRIFGVALSIFCALIVANCGETTPHHIDQRILENQGLNTSTENNITYTTNTTTKFTTIQPVNNSSILVTNTPSTDAGVSTKVTRKHVNITALLRNNDNVAEIVLNNTAVQNNSLPLVSVTNNQTNADSKEVEPIDTEVDDLLNHNLEEQHGPLYEKQQHPIDSLEPIHFADKIDTETELIEDGENTEDELRRIHNYKVVERSPAVPLAIILVSVFVTMSVLSYAGLLLWRKYLEDRYGSRTLLVDAEEFSDPGDLKHFTI